MTNTSDWAPPVGRGRRSSLERLPSALRETVDTAIADGATLTEIAALIRAEGGTCSRSAIARYARRLRGLLRLQHEADRMAEGWVRTLAERVEGGASAPMIEAVRSLVLRSLADLGEREDAVPTEEIARLALVVRRLESADQTRVAREHAAKEAARAAGGKKLKPLTPEAVATIRKAVEGEFGLQLRREQGEEVYW